MRMVPTISAVVAIMLLTSCTSSSDESATTATSTPTSIVSLTTLPPATTTSAAPPSTEATTTTTTAPPPENECVVEGMASTDQPMQGCTVLGITIVAGEDVDARAVSGTADRVYNMLLNRPDIHGAILESGVEGRVIPADTAITALPEYEDLYDQYPGTDWRRLGRSFPGTELVPYFSGAEENLLCSDSDRYEGEDTLVRVFALTMRRFGLDVVDEGASASIDQAYGRAIAAGLWENTLAEINSDEYWMEGVQSYFDANLEDNAEDRDPNSSHNSVNTREELADYDPALFSIAQAVFGDTEWRPACP